MREIEVVLDGLGFPESTRWRDGRVWLSNWGAGEVLAVTPGGEREVVARLAPDTLPFSIDWLPDGRLLVVDGPRQLLLRQDPGGSLATLADLGGIGSNWAVNSTHTLFVILEAPRASRQTFRVVVGR